mmetsp:Transcript_148667/g.477383  ORF Transcript_148667/g.477383 Transcript_148667/m.477383 type:complete len:233 (+) Transcript_148667:205-903(+)
MPQPLFPLVFFLSHSACNASRAWVLSCLWPARSPIFLMAFTSNSFAFVFFLLPSSRPPRGLKRGLLNHDRMPDPFDVAEAASPPRGERGELPPRAARGEPPRGELGEPPFGLEALSAMLALLRDLLTRALLRGDRPGDRPGEAGAPLRVVTLPGEPGEPLGEVLALRPSAMARASSSSCNRSSFISLLCSLYRVYPQAPPAAQQQQQQHAPPPMPTSAHGISSSGSGTTSGF